MRGALLCPPSSTDEPSPKDLNRRIPSTLLRVSPVVDPLAVLRFLGESSDRLGWLVPEKK